MEYFQSRARSELRERSKRATQRPAQKAVWVARLLRSQGSLRVLCAFVADSYTRVSDIPTLKKRRLGLSILGSRV